MYGLAKTLSQRVNAFSMAISSRGISFASPESDFVARQLFCNIDTNKDSVITREEMLAVAANIGLNQPDTSRLFDLLDTNADGKVDQAEFSHISRKLAELSVSKKISFASPESDFMSCQENDRDDLSKLPSKIMDMLLFPSDLSFATAESDFSQNLRPRLNPEHAWLPHISSRP